jgi:LPS O-antigen subunit length determinant protein (WzzB/FepE family)
MGSAKRAITAVATGGISEVVKKFESSDTLRAMTGRETSAEKAAMGEQKAALASAKAEADMNLEARRKRMELKKAGRGSLLSGSETGVATTSTLG